MIRANLLDALRLACAEAGVVYKDVPSDGRWHESDLEDDRRGKGDGRIKLFADGQGGIVANWKSGEPITFFADDDRELDAAARAERDRLRRESIKLAQADEAKRREKARTVAAALWKAAKPIAEPHPYLTRKGVEPVATLREITADRAAKILGYSPKSEGQPLAGRLILAPVKIAGQLSTAGADRRSRLEVCDRRRRQGWRTLGNGGPAEGRRRRARAADRRRRLDLSLGCPGDRPAGRRGALM
jgi:putative DNA primase/helicase